MWAGGRPQGLNALLCPSRKARGAPGGLLHGSTEGRFHRGKKMTGPGVK